ncbi:mucin-2-like [Corythoichthys intestinalis]|uniref:mucin-2-like n=1 Tax=Corythoichthys intestinalis TaxID=161448 RepID=UPI0025A60C98|nr:mucin-2-like [Corythoichthys intestinalis]
MESEQNPERVREEDNDDEDLAALCTTPTLSITEEILEFINQSRAKEGLLSMEQILDEPSKLQPNESNFTCPLPPLATNPEETLLPDSQEEVETHQDKAAETQTTSDCPDGLDSANVIAEIAEDGLRAEEEQEMDIRERSEDETKTMTTLTPPSPATELLPSVSHSESSNSFVNPVNCHTSSPRSKVKRGSALTRRDKRIIEKIRSYYEAAAELEEEEEVEDTEPEEDETSTKRNGFSQIPNDSVSHFACDSQEDNKNEPVETETCHEGEITPSAGPAPTALPEDSHDGSTNTPIHIIDSEAKDESLSDKSPISTRMEDNEDSEELLLSLPSTGVQPSEVEKKSEEGYGNVCSNRSEEELNEGAEACKQVEKPKQGNGPSPESVPLETTRTHQSECTQKELKESLKESSKTVPQTSWTGRKHKDLKTARNLQEVPSQIKLGRGSRQSRIVSTNRAFFEGMVSDITGIGLFEASPVADPSLMQNSERILNKVQTLANMYSAKVSSMKVPLHQKRAISVGNKTGDLTGQASAKGRMEMKKQGKCHVPTDDKPEPKSDSQTDGKNESPRISQTKVQNNPGTQTKNTVHGLAKAEMYGHQNQNNSKNQNRTICQDDKSSLDVQKMAPSIEQQNSPNPLEIRGFPLSRPRDFIAALKQEPAHGRVDDKHQTSITAETPSRTSSGSGFGMSNTPKFERHIYTEDTGPVNNIVQHSSQSSQRSHWNASKDDDGHHQYKQDLPAARGKSGLPSHIPARHVQDQKDSNPGEMFLKLASAKSPISPQHATLGLSGGSNKDLSTIDKTTLNSCSPQQWTSLTDVREPQVHPSSVSSLQVPQALDCQQKFPRQKPEEFQSVTNTWKVVNTTPNENRKADNQSPRQPTSLPIFTLHSGPCSPPRTSSDIFYQGEESSPPNQDTRFKPLSFRQSIGASPTSPNTPTCSSPFRAIPLSSPTHITSEAFVSPDDVSRTISCSSAPLSMVRSFPTVAPTPSSKGPSLRSPPCSSPVTPSTSFTRSLAASCISNTLAKKNNPRHQPSPFTSPSLQSPHLRRCAPSPTEVTSNGNPSSPLRNPCLSPSVHPSFPSNSQISSSPRQSHYSPQSSTSGQPHHSLSYNFSQNTKNPSLLPTPLKSQLANASTGVEQTTDRPSFVSHNRIARPFSASEPNSRVQSPSPTSFTRLCSPPPQYHYASTITDKPPNPRSSRTGGASSHNPLGLALEIPEASSASVSPQIFSPPAIGVPVWSCDIAVPQPRNPQSRSEIAKSSHSGSPQKSQALRRSLSNLSEPPTSPVQSRPVGPRYQVENSYGDDTFEKRGSRKGWSCDGSPAFLHSQSGIQSQVPPTLSPSHREHGLGADTFDMQGSRKGRSCVGSSAFLHSQSGLQSQVPPTISPSHREHGLGADTFNKQGSRSGWSCDSSPAFLRSQSGLQSQVPPILSPSHRELSISQPWLDGKELCHNYNGNFTAIRSSSSPTFPSSTATDWGDLQQEQGSCRSPVQSRPVGPRYRVKSSHAADIFDQRGSRRSCDGSLAFLHSQSGLQSQVPLTLSPSHTEHTISQPWLDYNSTSSPTFHSSTATDWGDLQPEQGSCRSQLICAYVGGPPQQPDFAPSCVVLSLPPASHHQIYQVQLQEAPNVGPSASTTSCPSLNKASNQKTSYATTVNLQIAGSGRITSFSTAHVSVSQTPLGELPRPRRVSVNGLSYASSPVTQNCGRL